MSRQARQFASSGIYHIVFRGVNHCHLFEAPDDFEKLLILLRAIKVELALEVYAYCLMSNHAHLIVKEKSPGDIVLAMRKLLGPYANWFNTKYERSGALIANRYKSECIEDDRYLLTLVRYIHQNPLTAGAARHIDGYRWSSYRDYYINNCAPNNCMSNNCTTLTDTDFVLGIFADKHEKALAEFAFYHETLETRDYSNPEKQTNNEEDVREIIIRLLGGKEPSSVCGLPRDERDSLLVLMRNQGLSIRQIERATGVSRGIVAKVRG